MSDLISRQAILKNIKKTRQSVQMMDDIRKASIIMNGMYLCEEAVRNQPSAQLEIIRCKDCKWKQGSECVRFADVRPFPDDFCSRAERRTDE